jgi:hypothetical protein
MFKCSPVDARKNLEAAQAMAEAGIDFVAVPVVSMVDKPELHNIVQNRFTLMAAWAEKEKDGLSNAKYKKLNDTIMSVAEHCHIPEWDGGE